jgi:hypothetical protein
VKIAKDGMVYVCDRQNDRIQVFQKDGKFVKEAFVSKTTTGDGSVWDVAFSPISGCSTSRTATTRKSGSSIARRSRCSAASATAALPGHFYGVGSVAVDSKGNVIRRNLRGKRVQKFVQE